MTRVNSAINPSSLCDQHLVAEYKEILRVSRESHRTPLHIIPAKFKLGTGHVKFFADKGMFMHRRHNDLITEMHKRGFSTNYTYQLHKDGYNKDYTSTVCEYEELVDRITLRMPQAPRYYKQYIDRDIAINMLRPYNIVTCN